MALARKWHLKMVKRKKWPQVRNFADLGRACAGRPKSRAMALKAPGPRLWPPPRAPLTGLARRRRFVIGWESLFFLESSLLLPLLSLDLANPNGHI